jgi:asparagine synthase (glutamine-hydrolysing)
MGTLLSGGLDSSLIAALAREAQPDLIAFGARWRGDPASDEGPAARRSATALGLELDLTEVTEEGWRHGFVPASVHFGLPLANASSVPIAQMAERAHSFGIKVLLTGEGADELFCGYGSLHAEQLRGFLSPVARVVRAVEPYIGGDVLQSVGRAFGRGTKPPGTPSPDGPTWKALAGASDSPSRRHDAYSHHDGPRGNCETSLLDRLDYTLSHLLNRMDTNMMQTSVEARVPFLDPRVVRLALNLPLEARVEPWSKGILRDAARKVLPWRVAHRPKIYGMDFAAGHWIERAADPDFLNNGLMRDALQIPSDELIRTLASATGALRVRLWSAEVWCRSILGGQTVGEIERALWPHGP